MKLDSENDRNVLLGLIHNAQIQGAAVMVIADLVQRISTAEIAEPAEAAKTEKVEPKAA